MMINRWDITMLKFGKSTISMAMASIANLLVVSNMFYFPEYMGLSFPLTFIFFKMVKTTNQIWFYIRFLYIYMVSYMTGVYLIFTIITGLFSDGFMNATEKNHAAAQ